MMIKTKTTANTNTKVKANFEDVLPKLTQMEIFSKFNPENERDLEILKKVFDRLIPHHFKKGETIIKEGEKGELFYILYKGSVQVRQKTFSNDTIALANLDDSMNIFFGETALIGQDTRSASVVAVTDCETIALSGADFLQLSEDEPSFGFRVTLILARRMAATIRRTNQDKTTLYEALLSEVEGTFGA